MVPSISIETVARMIIGMSLKGVIVTPALSLKVV